MPPQTLVSSTAPARNQVMMSDGRRPTTSAELPDLPIRDVTAPELLAELTSVQQIIRVSDPAAVATEVTTGNPWLLSLFRQERRILHELEQRRALLTLGIGWTVVAKNGE